MVLKDPVTEIKTKTNTTPRAISPSVSRVRLLYLNRFLPVSIQQEEEWFDSLAKRKDDIVLAIETLDGLFIGSVGLHGIDWKNRTATHGALIGNKDYWGKGYGRDVYMTLFNYAFNSLNLRKICAQILSFNERSVKCALACGYQIEGKQRKQNYVKGEYWDLIIIGVFKEEWLLKWKEYNKEA